MGIQRLERMSEEEKFTAICTGDPSYDGAFFYAVTSTGICCFPSCPSRQPRRENVRFYATRQEALAAGFCPCTGCRFLERGRGRSGRLVGYAGGLALEERLIRLESAAKILR
jgi:methylphosphotriester-DNA--protein-cysteine methyltransferase